MSKFICEKCQSSSTCQLYQVSQHDSLRPIKSCYQFKKRKPTNADRIRNMTDEELSTWLAKITDCGECHVCGHVKCMASEESCACAWLDWLKQECET